MKTVGIMLRQKRLEKKLTLEDVEKSTKIRKKFLQSIENDDFSRIPSVSYAKGFVRNYAEFLGLDSHKIIAFFRRQSSEVTRSSLLPKGVSEPLNSSIFQLTPARFIVILGAFFSLVFLLYFLVQFRKIQNPPDLSVKSPEEYAITNKSRIDVLGQTDSDATVSVNGISTLVRSDGQFFEKVTLDPGINEISVTATSRYGKTKNLKVNVEYKPEE